MPPSVQKLVLMLGGRRREIKPRIFLWVIKLLGAECQMQIYGSDTEDFITRIMTCSLMLPSWQKFMTLLYWWWKGTSPLFLKCHSNWRLNIHVEKRTWWSGVCATSLSTFLSTRSTWEPCGAPSGRFPPRDANLSNLPQYRGLFKKQLGAYTKQFAGSLTPQMEAVERGLSALIYHTVASTRQHN